MVYAMPERRVPSRKCMVRRKEAKRSESRMVREVTRWTHSGAPLFATDQVT